MSVSGRKRWQRAAPALVCSRRVPLYPSEERQRKLETSPHQMAALAPERAACTCS